MQNSVERTTEETDADLSGNRSGDVSKCPMAGKCSLQFHPLSATDHPNMAAHLGFRLAYTILAWFVLGIGATDRGFFVAVFLFVLPVLMDCMKFTPQTKARTVIKHIEIFIAATWSILSLLGLAGVLIVNPTETDVVIGTASNFIGFKLSGVPIQHVWISLFSVTFITAVDWFCNSTKLENAYYDDTPTEEGER